MAFIKQDLGDVRESQPVPEGEYDLRIIKADRVESKKGNMMTKVLIRIDDPDYPNASPISHFLVDITKDTPEDQAQMRKLDQKRFLVAFDVPHDDNGYDSDDLPGAEARMLLTRDENDDGMVFNRLRLPRLQE